MMKQSKNIQNFMCTDSTISEFRSIIDQESLKRANARSQCKEEFL